MRDAGLVERPRQGVGTWTQSVAHDDQRLQPAVDADEDPGPPGLAVDRSVRGVSARPRVAPLLEPSARAHGDPVALDLAGDAMSRLLRDRGRQRELDPAGRRPEYEALGEDVGGHLVDRGREAERLFRSQAAERHDPFELRLAEGERARLVEQHGSGSAEPLQSARPLDDDTGPGRPREAGHEGDRGSQDERARRRHDHDREPPRRVARYQPGEPGDRE